MSATDLRVVLLGLLVGLSSSVSKMSRDQLVKLQHREFSHNLVSDFMFCLLYTSDAADE